MKITVESTDKRVSLNGIEARVWEGKTESGIAVICFIASVAVRKEADQSEFLRELKEHKTPSAEASSFPSRMVL